MNTYTHTKHHIERLYLEWFNDFITVARFAEYHNTSEPRARRIIIVGRRINHAPNCAVNPTLRGE